MARLLSTTTLLALVALACHAVAASEISGVAGLRDVCKTGCDATLSNCSGGCSEEITADMSFFTVCQTECERTHQYCTAGCSRR